MCRNEDDRKEREKGREGGREGGREVRTVEETLHDQGPSEAVLDPSEYTPLVPQLDR